MFVWAVIAVISKRNRKFKNYNSETWEASKQLQYTPGGEIYQKKLFLFNWHWHHTNCLMSNVSATLCIYFFSFEKLSSHIHHCKENGINNIIHLACVVVVLLESIILVVRHHTWHGKDTETRHTILSQIFLMVFNAIT